MIGKLAQLCDDALPRLDPNSTAVWFSSEYVQRYGPVAETASVLSHRSGLKNDNSGVYVSDRSKCAYTLHLS